MREQQSKGSWFGRLVRRVVVVVGAVALTATFFLVLPVIQAMNAERDDRDRYVEVDATSLPPPPPPPEDPPDQEDPPPEEPPPELEPEAKPLDLSELELALNPGFGEGWLGGDFTVNLDNVIDAGGDDVESVFSLADLDSKPRVVHQPSPVLGAKARKKAPGTVYILFTVDVDGRVEDPRVQSSTDPVFERPALSAVKKWKFEPGRRNGEPVSFRMRVPITFPEP